MIEITDFFNTKYLKALYKDKLSNSRAKGIDKINHLNFDKKLETELDIIVRKVNAGTYSFSPYIENLKLKGRNKAPRIISIPTLRDRLVLLTIKEMLHTAFPECVNRRLPNSYIRDIKGYLKESSSSEYFIKLDIEKFYDNIDRNILLDKIDSRLNENLKTLIYDSITTPTIPLYTKKEDYSEYLLEEGVPQGLSISNILAQIYLKEVDEVIDRRKFFYKRYVDDIIILDRKKISDYRYRNIQIALNKINLNLNSDKTEKGFLKDGFAFLSYKINDKQISIADSNVELFIRRIAGKFTWFKNGIKDKSNRPNWLQDDSRFKEVFIEELNEMITGIISDSRNYGWLFYFSEMTDEKLLHRIDKIIARFFNPIQQFENKRPDSLKKISRTYKVIKHQKNKNYIANFDNFDSLRSKREYLVYRGKIDPETDYTDTDILRYFDKFKKKQIENIERDIGYNYN
jgi:retron-type reverse transcriptase